MVSHLRLHAKAKQSKALASAFLVVIDNSLRSCQTLMKYLLSSALLIPVLAATILSLRAADKEEGFTDLYNGKDLSGWTTTGNWLAEKDGVLAIRPREGEEGWKRFSAYLYTEKKYDNFIFKLEFKIPPQGNSGVFLNVADISDPVEQGLEVQILDSYGVEKELGHHDNGGIIKTSGPKKNASKPAGEWNQMTITSQGEQLKVELNGELIQDINLSDSEAKDKPKSGHIALQDHGLPLEFRNIRIKEL